MSRRVGDRGVRPILGTSLREFILLAQYRERILYVNMSSGNLICPRIGLALWKGDQEPRVEHG